MPNIFRLNTPDDFVIHGYHESCRSKRLVVLSHGLTSSPDGQTQVNARAFFIESGYDVVSFYYYSEEKPQARSILNANLAQHAEDLNLVVSHFRQEYEKVFTAGHSYGGVAMVYAQPKVDAYSFWDSTYVPAWWKDATYDADKKCYRPDWEKTRVIGIPLFNEAKSITEDDVIKRVRAVSVPSQVILAGAGSIKSERKKLYDNLTCHKELVDIEDAEHTFTLGDQPQKLLGVTKMWFDRF